MTRQSRVDRAAMTLAVEIARKENPQRRREIDDRLSSGDDWYEVATSCAFHCQRRALRLRPWQVAPCNLLPRDMDGDPLRGGQAAAELSARMEKAGVSLWHPDPIAALAAAEFELTTL